MFQAQSFDLTRHNTFGVAAMAREYFRVDSQQELLRLFDRGVLQQDDTLVLGGGSNILFAQDPPGVVVHYAAGGLQWDELDGEIVVTAGAGMIWDDLVAATTSRGIYGLENLSLIPGSVGAAPVQNIGAYGAELSEVFYTLGAFDRLKGSFRTFRAKECRFGYRSSLFKQEARGRYIITEVSLRLRRQGILKTGYAGLEAELERSGNLKPGPEEMRQAVIRIRESKLPDPSVLGNAGSFFKNPVVDETTFLRLQDDYPDLVSYPQADGRHKIAAGWLIDRAGWKGYQEGDAGVHERQALVLVNHGKASGMDILRLAARIREDVRERFRVSLEPEVNIIGAGI